MIHLIAAGTSSDPLQILLSYGPGGLIGLLFAAGYIVAKPTYQQVMKERDDARAQLKEAQNALIARQNNLVAREDYQAVINDLSRLRTKMEDQMIPGMFQYGATLDRALTAMNRLAERTPV